MSEEERTRLPVEPAAPARGNNVLPIERPGLARVVCPECGKPVPADVHFCTSCHSFLASPHVGVLASPKRRLGASFVDGLLRDGGMLGSVVWPAIMPPGMGKVAVTILSAIYGISSMYLWTQGTTPAKRLLDMKVVTEDGETAGFFRMAFRETIGKAISLLFFGMGLLPILRDRDRQAWHDSMCGTWVVHEDD